MTACFSCSLILPSISTNDLSLPWPPSNPNRPFSPVFLRKDSCNNSPRIFARVLQQGPGAGVVSPEDLSLHNPPVETREDEQKEALRVFDGVAEGDTRSEDKSPSSSTRAKKKTEEEDENDNRFKLRNGREVSFLLGF